MWNRQARTRRNSIGTMGKDDSRWTPCRGGRPMPRQGGLCQAHLPITACRTSWSLYSGRGSHSAPDKHRIQGPGHRRRAYLCRTFTRSYRHST